jgi:hypothetical protein
MRINAAGVANGHCRAARLRNGGCVDKDAGRLKGGPEQASDCGQRRGLRQVPGVFRSRPNSKRKNSICSAETER